MFLVFEGLDGSGTTTQGKLLADYLEKKGTAVLHTSEPTTNPIGSMIRDALTHQWETSPQALQLLFTADRAHHLAFEIEPALREGKIVICDRYVWSTIAYGSLDSDTEWLAAINSEFRAPDFTFLLQVSTETCWKRIEKRGNEVELFEAEEKLKKVWETFQQLAASADNYAILDAEKTSPEVLEEAMKILNSKFKI